MDELAGRYLTLCLRLARLVPDLVAWFTGPDRLLAAVHSEPRRLPDRLAAEADRLAADVASEPTLPTDRAAWFARQLAAIAATGRGRAGESAPLRGYVRTVLDLELDEDVTGVLDGARERLETALPGPGPWWARLERHRDAFALPPDRALELVARAAHLLRPTATATFRLADEHVQVRPAPASGGPLRLRGRPHGPGVTWLEVEPGTVTPARLLHLVAAHSYPGEHTIRTLRTTLLVDQFGRGECALALRRSPDRVATAGTAAVALEALVARHERELLVGTLAELGDVDVDPATDLEVVESAQELELVLPVAALALHEHGPDAARARLERWWPAPPDDRAAWLDRLADRDAATGAFVVPYGRLATRRFLAKQDEPREGFRRLTTDQLTPSTLLAGR